VQLQVRIKPIYYKQITKNKNNTNDNKSDNKSDNTIKNEHVGKKQKT